MPLKLDYSKGLAIHRAHGHVVFLVEADKQNKPEQWIKQICSAVKCTGVRNDWRNNIPGMW